jgi:predicted ATP-dependent endonuclease of OLD family
VRSVQAQQRIDLWEKSLEILESDPIFKFIDIKDIANQYSSDSSSIEKIFKKLSSGHKIVVLTITQLVENLEEKSLVLLDEPEAHLHPPLLSAFIRSLSELLIRKNGVAIIATHSPVILQEVPKNCVWKISRSIAESKVERPSIETFGENIGVLTREVFGLEVTQAGFHQMLKSAAERGLDFDATLDVFNNQLGNEARAILRALIFKRDN